MLIAHLLSQRIEAQQEAYREGRARTEPCSSGKVRNVVNLDSIVNSEKLQTTTNGGVLNRAVLINIFNFRVRYPGVIFKKGRKVTTGDIAAFIDRRGQDGATMLAVPDGIVRASAEERDAEWSASNDHALGSYSGNLGNEVSANRFVSRCGSPLFSGSFAPVSLRQANGHEGDTLFGLDIGVEIAKQVNPRSYYGIQRENLKEQPGKASGTGLERARNPRASQYR